MAEEKDEQKKSLMKIAAIIGAGLAAFAAQGGAIYNYGSSSGENFAVGKMENVLQQANSKLVTTWRTAEEKGYATISFDENGSIGVRFKDKSEVCAGFRPFRSDAEPRTSIPQAVPDTQE